MSISEFSAAIVFEVIFVVLLSIAYYVIKKKTLIATQKSTAEASAGSDLQGDLQIVQRKMRELEIKKSAFLSEEPVDKRSLAVCDYWLNVLNAEKHAIEVAGEDRDLFWLTAINHTDTSFVAQEDDQKVTQEALDERDEQIAQLKESLQNHELQIENLEKFRTLFFDLKKSVGSLQEKNQGLVDEIEVAIPDAEKSDTLKQLLASTQQEKEQLQHRVISIEQELKVLLKQVSPDDAGDEQQNGGAKGLSPSNPDELFSSIKSGTDKIKQVVAKQKLEITELNSLVNRLQLEVEERNQLVKQIQDIQQKSKELEDVLAILEDENGFLQKQVQELLRSDLEAKARDDSELHAVKDQLQDKNKRHLELEQKFSELEQEYLTLYAEAEALKKAV